MSEIEVCWLQRRQRPPCQDACPLHMDIPGYIKAIATGDYGRGISIVRETNPLPGISSRVCHHPCEDDCNRRLIDEPISIATLRRSLVDAAYESGLDRPNTVAGTRPQKVAIVGSGPAGLVAAYDLACRGYNVTIFEAMPTPGGMLVAGIPEFVLPIWLVYRETQYIEELGIEIQTGCKLGKEFSLEDLRQRYDAVLLAMGAQKSVELSIEGAKVDNVLQALSFLRDLRAGGKFDFRGQVVVVIGGGNVAINASRVAMRLGAKEVHIACLEPRGQMPGFPREIEGAEEEGIGLHCSLAPQRFNGDGILEFRQVEKIIVEPDGKLKWTLASGPGPEYTLNADKVILAIGQKPDLSSLELKERDNGNLVVDSQTLATDIPRVFVAGDMIGIGKDIGGSVTDAMASGRRAAMSVHHYLSGELVREQEEPYKVFSLDPAILPEGIVRRERWEAPRLPIQKRVYSFDEVNLALPQRIAMEEARRCLNCAECGYCLFMRHWTCFERSKLLI